MSVAVEAHLVPPHRRTTVTVSYPGLPTRTVTLVLGKDRNYN